jgi:hypothetical protein
MRSCTPVSRASTLEITNAERAARIAHRITNSGSDRSPLRSGQYRANGKITLKRIAKIPQRFRGGILVGRGFRIPEMAIAPMAGPNAPITPISIRYDGFFTDTITGTVQTIQEQAKARRKNAVIGCRRIVSDQECKIITPDESFALSHL